LKWSNIQKELKQANFMIKLYILNNIASDVVHIKNTEMQKYIWLKSENFIGVKAETLWRELGLL
jgi:hypothetical protein